jgi:hypothetical protein
MSGRLVTYKIRLPIEGGTVDHRFASEQASSTLPRKGILRNEANKSFIVNKCSAAIVLQLRLPRHGRGDSARCCRAAKHRSVGEQPARFARRLKRLPATAFRFPSDVRRDRRFVLIASHTGY